MKREARFEARITQMGRRWRVDVVEHRNWRPNPLVAEKVSTRRTETRARRLAQRLIEEAYEREARVSAPITVHREAVS